MHYRIATAEDKWVATAERMDGAFQEKLVGQRAILVDGQWAKNG